MKALILSAGQGTRLRPLTDDRPKGMVAIAGKPIIQWQIEMFHRLGIDDVAVVTGYEAGTTDDVDAVRFHNAEYDSTNMVHSLFCAEEFLSGDVILSYGDILYTSDVLQKVIDADGPVSVVVDLDWERYFGERFGDAFLDAESLVMDATGAITSIGKRDPAPDEVQAQYIGLIKVSADGVAALSRIHADAVRTGRDLGWGRPARASYMTDLLQDAASRGTRVEAVPINRGWVEVDTLDDYEIAQRWAQTQLQQP